MQGSLTYLTPRVLSVFRFVAGLQFLEHGTQKFFAIPPSDHTVHLFSLLGLQGGIELAGGVLMILGLFTRPVAFVLSGNMAVAYFMVHMQRNFFPATNGGDAAILYCFAFLFMSVAGGGAWSLDALRRRDSAPGSSAPAANQRAAFADASAGRNRGS